MKNIIKPLIAGLAVFGLALQARAQIAVIVFNPANSAAFNQRVTNANSQAKTYGSSGSAVAKYANDPGSYIYVTQTSTGSATTSPLGNGKYEVTLNDNPTTKFLSAGDYGATIGAGEDPKDDATTWGHEVAHVATYSNNSSNAAREADVIRNYENPMRSASGQPQRTTYGGNPVQPNQSAWQSFANWFRSIFE